MKKEIEFGIRPVSSKQIVKAGFTLAVGHLILPLIKFKDARNFEAFPERNKRNNEKEN